MESSGTEKEVGNTCGSTVLLLREHLPQKEVRAQAVWISQERGCRPKRTARKK